MGGIVVVGAQWGDEGKGKVVDFLSESFDIVVRYNGGGNAGHTIIFGDKEYKMHYIPSGALQGKLCILGNGMVINPEELVNEINTLKKDFQINIAISKKAHVIFPFHIAMDFEMGKTIGTTSKGIGPAYAFKMFRQNLRIGDLVQNNAVQNISTFLESMKDELTRRNIISSSEFDAYKTQVSEKYANLGQQIKDFACDIEELINQALIDGKNVLFEGAQGVMLDIDFGTYPFVTSSSTVAQGAFSGTGANPFFLRKVIGISKAYTTRVGSGPFPTEIIGREAEFLRKVGNEYGATTGRPRRVGYLDLFALKYAISVSSISELAITKIDVLSAIENIKVCTGYKLDDKDIDYFPSNIYELERVTPKYESLPKVEQLSKEEWKSYIGKAKTQLPEGIKVYINFIEDYLRIPVNLLSFGPGRGDTIAYG